jgi:hypothetical protein
VFHRPLRPVGLVGLRAPQDRRARLKENLLAIFVGDDTRGVEDQLPHRSAIIGRLREGGALVDVEAYEPTKRPFAERLREAARRHLSNAVTSRRGQFTFTQILRVGSYDATLMRVERIHLPDLLVDWIDGEAIPTGRDESPAELWRTTAMALGVPPRLTPDQRMPVIKQISFLAEDYTACDMKNGADQLATLAMWLEQGGDEGRR